MEVIFFIVFPVVVLVVIVMVVIFFFCLFIIVFVKCLCLSVIFAINVWSGLFTSCFKLISGLFLSLSKMNRFLLLTGIGPTVSRDDALTWIQVVFATHLDYPKTIINTGNMIFISKFIKCSATLYGSPRCLEDGKAIL